MANYSTYARAVLSNSESISNLICKYSTAGGEALPESNEYLGRFAFLSMEQIEQALLNPQNSIKDKIVLFAELIKLHRYIISLQQEAYHQQLIIEEGIKEIRNKYPKATKSQKEEFTEAVHKLEQEYKKITEMQKQFEKQESELQDFEEQLDTMTLEQDQDWDAYREEFLNLLADHLEKHGVPLTELERNELLTSDIWVEVIKRFNVQTMDVPNTIDLANPDYATYFELKAFLAIHASLSRRMLPNSPEDILNA